MPTFIDEATELPNLVIFRPTFNASQTPTALICQANYWLRALNQSDNTQFKTTDTKSFSFDLLGTKATSTVSVGGLGTVTYLQIAKAIKLMIDAERALAL